MVTVSYTHLDVYKRQIPYLLQYLQRADIDMVREVYRTYGLCHYSNEGAGRGI